MKPVRARLFMGVVFALLSIAIAHQSRGQGTQQPSQKSEMKPMEKMSMDEMMKDCMQHQQTVMQSIDQMSKTMEGAKQSNDPAKMRAAIDQAQKQLSEMKEHMSMCRNMMGMMQKMQGGMMKGSSK